MISTDTLPQLLTQLGFSKHGASYSKTIGSATLKVDTKEQRITYPDGLIVNGEFTCNFSSSENFVVLECVNRLLEKGYKPEHIELEPKWKLVSQEKLLPNHNWKNSKFLCRLSPTSKNSSPKSKPWSATSPVRKPSSPQPQPKNKPSCNGICRKVEHEYFLQHS